MPALILVTDETRLADPLPALDRLPPGAGVLLRHYSCANRPGLARALARAARRRRVALLVGGGDWRLAAAVGADGVHLPETLARTLADPGLRLWLRRGHVLSVAAHSRAALARAAGLGADAALLSPVFPTASHPGAPTLGATRFALWARAARLPVVALGGVNGRTARALRCAAGCAAIGGLLG
ncbi:MAG: thiamine phosphate synthase [Bacteroidales bacterium]